MATKVDAKTQQPALNTGADVPDVTTKSSPAIKPVQTESTLTSADPIKKEKAAESSGFLACVEGFFKGLCSVCTWLYNLICGAKNPEKKPEGTPEGKQKTKAEETAATTIAGVAGAAALLNKGALDGGNAGRVENAKTEEPKKVEKTELPASQPETVVKTTEEAKEPVVITTQTTGTTSSDPASAKPAETVVA